MSNDTTIKVITVTPELAEQWLGKNTHNRKLREPHMRGLVEDIKAGNWKWNGDSIKFAADGTLLDGQHRLAAIVRAGIPVEMLVIRGLENESQHTMDTGAKRSAGDMLKLRGEKHYNPLAAGLRSCLLWDQGARSFSGSGSGITVTNSMILDYLNKHPEMRGYVSKFVFLRNHIKMPASVGVTAIKLFTEIDAEDAEHFFDRLASGEGYKGDPIFELARALQDASDKTKISRTPTWKLAVMIKAWNKYRLGEPLKMLAYRPGGSNREQFPEPI